MQAGLFRALRRTGIGLTILLLAGCVVQSLTPFYNEESVISMPQLHGRWQLVTEMGEDVSRKDIRPWIIGNGFAKVFDEEGVGAPLKITFFRIKTTTFVDITAGDLNKEVKLNLLWMLHVAPVHTVCKLIVRGNRLILIPLDKYWLERAVKGKKVKLRHIRPMKKDALTVYYPSTETWMRFLKLHRDDVHAFPESGRYELVRLPAESGKQGESVK